MSSEMSFLFACDLDGTLLPNTGKSAASGCMQRTQHLLDKVREIGVPVCFVTGRHFSLAKKGTNTFRLSSPSWWICNVGTEIYDSKGRADADWQRQLGPKFDHDALRRTLSNIPGLLVQEPINQGCHKFSLYYPKPAPNQLQAEILHRASAFADDLQLVACVEERSGRTLLDIIPAKAGNKHAVEYMAQRYGLSREKVFFAGDSGNDLDILLSGVCGTLVGNRPDALQSQLRAMQTRYAEAQLYMASANYGDGIIEGLSHYGFWSDSVLDMRSGGESSAR